jgi:predicted transcriptional regulator
MGAEIVGWLAKLKNILTKARGHCSILVTTKKEASVEFSQAELFKVLGVESRIKIIELLKASGPQGVKEISKAMGISPSAVSQHLKILKLAGLVTNERQGYFIPYEIDTVALEKCRQLLSEVCTCGCKCAGRIGEARLRRSEDRLELLKRYEKQLQKELDEVRARIAEIEEA